MVLWSLHRLSIFRIPFLCDCQWLDFLLQHHNDDALDNHHWSINLRVDGRLLSLLGTYKSHEIGRLGTFKSKWFCFKFQIFLSFVFISNFSFSLSYFYLDGNNAITERFSDAIFGRFTTDYSSFNCIYNANFIDTLRKNIQNIFKLKNLKYFPSIKSI